MNEAVIEQLKKSARQKCFYDELVDNPDVIVDDFAGGNIDDAFNVGETAGEAMLARSILEELGISWEE